MCIYIYVCRYYSMADFCKKKKTEFFFFFFKFLSQLFNLNLSWAEIIVNKFSVLVKIYLFFVFFFVFCILSLTKSVYSRTKSLTLKRIVLSRVYSQATAPLEFFFFLLFFCFFFFFSTLLLLFTNVYSSSLWS